MYWYTSPIKLLLSYKLTTNLYVPSNRLSLKYKKYDDSLLGLLVSKYSLGLLVLSKTLVT